MLIALSCKMYVKIVEPVPFDLVCVLVALPVVPAEAKDLRRRFDRVCKNYREVKNIEKILPENQSKLRTVYTINVKLTFSVAQLRPKLKSAQISGLQRLALGDEGGDFGVCEQHAQL